MSVHDDLAELAEIGRDPVRGGWSRHGWDAADLAMRAWFRRRAAASGMAVWEDRNGDLWAGELAGGVIVSGSHLDSVPGGGALDGPLGVVSAFAAVDRVRAGGATTRPLAVVAFAEEEGSRFGIACLGSRLLTGAIPPPAAFLPVAAEQGLDPGPDPALLRRIGALVELHVEQGRALADLGAPVAVATSVLAHGRWRIDVTGEGNHAGATPMRGRRDPMVAAARIVAAVRDAALAADGTRATVGRLTAVPGGTNVIPSAVTLMLDARGPDLAAVEALVARIAEAARALAAAEGCAVAVAEESRSPEVHFDAALRERIRAVLSDARPAGPVPELATGAGHDAAILAAVLPTAMLFVRNPTGVSHAPSESASAADIDAGVDALTAVLADLAR